MSGSDINKLALDPKFAAPKRKYASKARSVNELFSEVDHEAAFKDKRGRPWLKNPRAYARAKVLAKIKETAIDESDTEEERKQTVSSDDGDHHSASTSCASSDEAESTDDDVSSPEDIEDQFESVADLQDADWSTLTKDAVEARITSRRLALLHFDWDSVKADNIFMTLQSFVPARGHIEKVTIYPSQFGIQRMSEEAKHGPPELAFTDHIDSASTQSSIASNRLQPPVELDDKAGWRAASVSLKRRVRRYQLARLKYFYAIIEFDSVETAEAVYEACDGLEYESSGCRFDLRFVGDEEVFTVEPEHAHLVSECREINKNKYAPRPFETAALHSTRIGITWDKTPTERTCWLREQFDVNADPQSTLMSNRDELAKYMALSSSGASTAASSDVDEPPPALTVPRIRRHRPKKVSPAEIRAALLGLTGKSEEDKSSNDSDSEEEVFDLNGKLNGSDEDEEYDLRPVEKKKKNTAKSLGNSRKIPKYVLPEAMDEDMNDVSADVSDAELDRETDRKSEKRKKRYKNIQREKMMAKKRKTQERLGKQAKLWMQMYTDDGNGTADGPIGVDEQDSRFDAFLTDPSFRISQTHRDYKEASDFLHYMNIRKSTLSLIQPTESKVS